MTPLVYVRDSGTLVWETGCGSGSAAIGAWRAWKQGGGTVTTPVRQPGGVIQVCAGGNGGLPDAVSITGRVRIGEERFCDNL
jgi:diaminopimelate epimerase